MSSSTSTTQCRRHQDSTETLFIMIQRVPKISYASGKNIKPGSN